MRHTSYRPILECLEDRLAPATHIWAGAVGANWSVAGNWGGGIPTNDEPGGTFVQFGSGSTSTDDIAGLAIDGLDFTAGGNTILGSARSNVALGIVGQPSFGIVNETGINTVALPVHLLTHDANILVSAGVLSLASAISGPVGVRLLAGSAAGTLQFDGSLANTYTGITEVDEGTLRLNHSPGKAAIPGGLTIGDGSGAAGTAVVRWLQDAQVRQSTAVGIDSDGQLDLNALNDTIGMLNMTGGVVTTGDAGMLTLNGDVSASSIGDSVADITGKLNLGTATRTFNVSNFLDISAGISGAASVGLTKTGPGTLLFDGRPGNLYGGTTTVNDGTLALNKQNPFDVVYGVVGALVVGDGLGGPSTAVVLDQHFFELAQNLPVTINSDGLLDITDDEVLSLNMTGGSVITTSFLQLKGNVTATSDGAGNPATIAGTGAGNLYIPAFNPTRTFTVNPGPGAVQLDISAVINDQGGGTSLVKAGSGTLRLSGAAANAYVGATTVSAGTLVLNNSKGVAVPGDLFIGSANGAAGTALVRLTMPNQINPKSVVQIQDANRLDLNNLAQTIGQLNLLGTSFGFAQTTTADAGGAHTSYTFTIDGAATVTNAATGKVVVTGVGGSNTAILITNDTYKDTNGATQETRESIALGSLADPGVGTLQKFDQSGNPFTFLSLSNFATSYAYVGRNDGTVQLYASTGVPYNGFVSAGNYSYIAGQGLFHEAQGAPFVYGYSAGQATDFAFHYAADAGSSFVVSGTAFSYLSATDTVNGVTQSYFNVGVGFLLNTGVAKNPGKDFAYIIDSPGNDTFVGGTAYSFMFATDTRGNFTEFDAAYGFALIFGQSFVGSADTASNSDPTRNILVGFRLT